MVSVLFFVELIRKPISLFVASTPNRFAEWNVSLYMIKAISVNIVFVFFDTKLRIKAAYLPLLPKLIIAHIGALDPSMRHYSYNFNGKHFSIIFDKTLTAALWADVKNTSSSSLPTSSIVGL